MNAPTPTPEAVPRRPPPPWLFGVAAVPYGIFNGLVALALPYLLRRQGIPLERIASIVALVQTPAIWYFLWAPAVDMRFRRRTWVIVLAVASGATVAIALNLELQTSLAAATTLLVAASVLNQPISSALGGLAAAVAPPALRNRTAGWGQAGALGAGVAGGAIALWLARTWSPGAVALVIGALVMLPALSVLAIDEPQPLEVRFGARLRAMWREITVGLRDRRAWLAFFFFITPAGAGALMMLFSAVAVDYHASTSVVIWVIGLGGGALTAVGALVGGTVCERFHPWRVYGLAGVLSAACAGAMILAPATLAAYIAGASAYAFATGLSYAAFMAICLELLSEAEAAGSTRFTFFIAATNVPLVYMVWLDGLAQTHFGMNGMLGSDAIANAVFGVLLLILAAGVRRRAAGQSLEAR